MERGHLEDFDVDGRIILKWIMMWSVVNMKCIIFFDMTPCSPVEVTDVSDERTASIFRVETKTITNCRLGCDAVLSGR
jgi:hypothetical protein